MLATWDTASTLDRMFDDMMGSAFGAATTSNSNHERDGSLDRFQRSLDTLRKRSRHRIWWSSARIALRRGQSGEPLDQPAAERDALRKRV